MKKMSVTLIYDDTRLTSADICSVTGRRSFGETIFKRKSLQERTLEILRSLPFVGETVILKRDEMTGMPEALRLLENRQGMSLTGPVFRIFSDFLIVDSDAVGVLIEKACYAEEIYRIESIADPGRTSEKKRAAAVIYPSVESCKERFDELSGTQVIQTESLLDLSDIRNFRQFITSGFDARFFNALSGDEYTVVKSSVNKEKIRAEYEFYRLLPDEMRMWFAQAFDYREDEKGASYTMERYHMTDLALRFVHGAIDEEEFTQLMDKLFFFLSHRKEKQVSKEAYAACRKALYFDKVKERTERLKGLEEYDKIERILAASADFGSLDALLGRYYELFEWYQKETEDPRNEVFVVGHGDLCFSNILYNKEANLLRLIDPKGAFSEEELYTDPYYDLAKLSHSICGSYDYFNSGLFEISFSEENTLRLTIDENNGNYRNIFREYAEKNGFDFTRIRICEASLFLSMLPLHIDRPKKVLGFILNAQKILDELEEILYV